MVTVFEPGYDADDELYHIGTPHQGNIPHSGRYKYGSGENPMQHSVDFLSSYDKLKRQGLSEKDIARGLHMTVTELRKKKSIASDNIRAQKIARAVALKEHGYTNIKIGEMMDVNESVVRSWLKQNDKKSADQTQRVADTIKKRVDDLKPGESIDVGLGVERELGGISKTRLDTALYMLEMQGYNIYNLKIPQANQPNQKTTVKVITQPETDFMTVINNKAKIKPWTDYTPDDGVTMKALEYPAAVSGKRVFIRYGDQGGDDLDGTIQIRRGVDDLSLGKSSYAQVRINVDNKSYLKGMALYADDIDIPKGYDIVFNTNKKTGTPPEKVFKPLKDDPDNPFGASIKADGQSKYLGKDGKYHLSPINKLKEEGDWNNYSKSLSAQFLSKQRKDLIKSQIKITEDRYKDDYNDILKCTNPIVKRKLLIEFADKMDAAAGKLKVAALPRQSSKVLLPVPELKDNECYLPTYKNGERVVLIRYPHGGIFEIPDLVVNNKSKAGKRRLGDSLDAIGINKHVADKLSGADFDGDHVIVIPNTSKNRISTMKTLDALKGFDPKKEYPAVPGMKVMTEKNKQAEMGKISNLITDMTIAGADFDEISRAVKHSMCVIDAVKHELNYTRSFEVNGIAALKKKYQGRSTAGAHTLISRAESTAYVPERKKFTYKIDPKTGEKIYIDTHRTYINKAGKEVQATEKVTKMSLVKDARELSSGTAKEDLYAGYANYLKGLANKARLEYIGIDKPKRDPNAKIKYAQEVASLDIKLKRALSNAPRERMAQTMAAAVVEQKKKDNPDLTLKENKDALKKVSQHALLNARARYGASKKDVYISISPREWEAIQHNAVSSNKLEDILNNCDPDSVKELAMPRNTGRISAIKKNRVKNLLSKDYTLAEISEATGLSVAEISMIKKGE